MIICFATHKGGTGKTTTSINVSAALARAGKKTLLVDLDPQGHSTVGLGFELEYDDGNIADILLNPKVKLDQVILPSEQYADLDLVPSNIRLASVAESLLAKMKREERLKKSLYPLAHKYEWMIIDCPPALGVLTANAVNASDVVLIPCQVGARALDGLGDLLDLVHILKGEDFNDWWILQTMIDKRNKVTLEIFQQQLGPYMDKKKVLETYIPQNEALNQAQIARLDIFSFENGCNGAKAYDNLAAELITRFN